HKGTRGRGRWQTTLKCEISHTFGGQAALNDNSVRLCSRHGRKGSVEFLIRSAYHDWLNLNTCNAAGALSFIENYVREQRVCRVGENRYLPRRSQHVAKQFDAFSNHDGRHQRHPSNVSTGMCQAGNYAGFDRVGREYHGWYSTCCLLRRQCAGDVERHNNIDLEPDKLGGKLGKSVQLSFRGAKLKRNVLPLQIAKFTQPFPEFLLERLCVRQTDIECAYSSHPR